MVIRNADGSGNNFCQTLLDDQSAGASIQSVTSGMAPFSGSFTPNAPLAIFNGENADGTWLLRAQDFFSQDNGNIRAWSLILTPAVCDAPPQLSHLTAKKSVTGGNIVAGGDVVYTITVTNDGAGGQTDNPGHELTDVLPASLVLTGASSSIGNAVATVGTNTVTWDGALVGNGTATITVQANIKTGTEGTVISNQASVAYDADRNGTNESSGTSDDPSVGGANDPTSFMVPGAPLIATSTSLESSLNPSTFGAVILFTARVTPAQATGIVAFEDGGLARGTASLSGGVATFELSDLSVDVHTMTAHYVGSIVHAGSTSSPIDQVVNKAPTTTTLASSANPSTAGAAITLTVTTTPISSGDLVTFFDGATVLGTATLLGGVATLTVPGLAAGTHSLTAHTAFVTRYLPSTSAPLAQVVNPSALTATATSLVSSQTPTIFGASLTLTATVTPGGATGTVVFLDGSDALGSSTVTGGAASFTTADLPGGTHSLTAAYGGDTTFAASASAPLSQVVDPAGTTTAVSSSANPAGAGEPIELTITVASTAGSPDGLVTVLDGAREVTTADLVKGAATVTITLPSGTHAVTVAYPGDASFAASTSAILSQVVTPGLTPDAGKITLADAGALPDAGPPHADAAPGTRDAGVTVDAPGASPDAGAETSSSSGCGCQTGPSSPGNAFALAMVALWALRRWRRGAR
jgi:uncharacterized repeat protein (TIGR01451 family)/MYXO-CTERM domain-containing protein